MALVISLAGEAEDIPAPQLAPIAGDRAHRIERARYLEQKDRRVAGMYDVVEHQRMTVRILSNAQTYLLAHLLAYVLGYGHRIGIAPGARRVPGCHQRGWMQRRE